MQIQFILVLEHVVTGDALEAHVERRVVHVRQVPPQVGNGLLTTLALWTRVAGGGGDVVATIEVSMLQSLVLP